MEPVRIGIIGLGNMGQGHAKTCSESRELELVAVCDIDPDRLSPYDSVPLRTDSYEELLTAESVEAVLIATTHYSHTPLAISAFQRGIHVLCEKPIGAHVNDARSMIEAYESARASVPGLCFGAVFQQRTTSCWQKIKELIGGGVLGRLVRATWIITDWFRTQFYYDQGTWRATWAGEGGGVLLNQCIHNLDLYQWFFGMPDSVLGQVGLGKYHQIEVEDEISAVFRHPNGMTGHFISSTAESPGTNRLEVVGENGKLVFENGSLVLDRNSQSMLDAIRTEKRAFMHVDHQAETVELADGGGSHLETIERFARAVRGNGTLVAEGTEGINSVALANAILMSHSTASPVSLPLDGDAYAELLQRLISESEK